MATSRKEIEGWFLRGIAGKATHMIVVCDTFDYEDYPTYVFDGDNPRKEVEKIDGKDMQKVMEVYDLSKDMQEQLNETRAMNF